MANIQVKSPNGFTMTVSEEAYENFYKNAGYTRVGEGDVYQLDREDFKVDVEEENKEQENEGIDTSTTTETTTEAVTANVDEEEEDEERRLSDQEIIDLYQEYGFEVPDVNWVRDNLPTTKGALETVLQNQKEKRQSQQQQQQQTEQDTTDTGQQQDTGPKQFYRLGRNIYDAETDSMISPEEWRKNWSGQATEVEAPENAVFDKQIYQDPDNPNNLYYKRGERFYKVQDENELKNLVNQEGYIDTRVSLPDDAPRGDVVSPQEQEKSVGEARNVTKEALEEGRITQNQKRVIDTLTENLPPGVEEDPEEILNTFNQIKEETIDPYYKELIDAAAQDYRDAFEYAQQQREIAKERQEERTEEEIESERERLERQGLTFSGEAVERLGKESAYAREGGEEAIPEQEQQGGEYLEGEVPQEARLRASSSRAKYKEDMRKLGRELESQIGTEEMQERGLLDTIPFQEAGISRTSQIEQQRQKSEAQTLQSIINNYAQRQTGMRNQRYNFGSVGSNNQR